MGVGQCAPRDRFGPAGPKGFLGTLLGFHLDHGRREAEIAASINGVALTATVRWQNGHHQRPNGRLSGPITSPAWGHLLTGSKNYE